jgi:hypothetical protein
MPARRGALAGLVLLLCIAAPLGGAAAAAAAPIRPIPAAQARVWFLRQFAPTESLAAPMLFANAAPFAYSRPGTAFFRDFPPGTYTFSVASYGVDTGQAQTLRLVSGTQTYLEVQTLTGWSTGCNYARDTFYVREIPPDWAEMYLPQMNNLGAR